MCQHTTQITFQHARSKQVILAGILHKPNASAPSSEKKIKNKKQVILAGISHKPDASAPASDAASAAPRAPDPGMLTYADVC